MKTTLPKGTYSLISVSYCPLIDSIGTCCQNCGRLISNIATVKHMESDNTFIIGLDCAKTLLEKEAYNDASVQIREKKKTVEKIAWCQKNQKPFVLNEFGQPCHPPETRSGYFIVI